MRIKIIATIFVLTSITSCASTNDGGWSHNQGKGTVAGGIIGATAGGVIGHQHGKQKEGILIGTLLGGFLGNKIGEGKDTRHQSKPSNVDRELEYERARAKALEQELKRAREIKNLQDRQKRAEQELSNIRK